MYSMTGYGFAEELYDDFQISIEVKSLNNRFLDINLRLPYVLNYYDTNIRNSVKKYNKRGKIEVFINLKELKHDFEIKADLALAERYYDTYKKIIDFLKEKGFNDYIRLYNLLNANGIITVDERTDAEKIWNGTEKLLEKTLEQLVETKLREGESTKKDLNKILSFMENNILKIESRSDESVILFEQKLTKKIQDFIKDNDFNEERVLQEVAMMSTKVDINEEINRLSSHIQLFKNTLDEKGGIGRKLDFISQEMHREINTIGSKSMHFDISNMVINLKTELEKLKEQIRNVE